MLPFASALANPESQQAAIAALRQKADRQKTTPKRSFKSSVAALAYRNRWTALAPRTCRGRNCCNKLLWAGFSDQIYVVSAEISANPKQSLCRRHNPNFDTQWVRRATHYEIEFKGDGPKSSIGRNHGKCGKRGCLVSQRSQDVSAKQRAVGIQLLRR